MPFTNILKNKKQLAVLLIILSVIFILIVVYNRDSDIEQSEQEILLYFSDLDAMYLETEMRIVETDDLYLNAVNELIKGPERNLNKTIPEEVEVLGVELNNDLILVNFNEKLKENHWGGSTGERMTVYSIVNTLTQFGEINLVKILIDGEEIETLTGHMDLSVPVEADYEIVAD